MSDQATQKQQFMVSVSEPEEVAGAVRFTFMPNVPQHERSTPRHVPQFIVGVTQQAGGLAFDWSGTPDDPEAAREEIEAEVAVRMKERANWIERVTALVGQVEQWARDLSWSTRRVEKKLDDARIGKHRVPALLMQEDTCRVLLEPVGRSTAGAEGVVDLYLMPAYDDIASFYYYANRWNLHYSPGTRPAAPMRDSEAMPLSKETLERVLAEMRQNAA